MTEKQEFADRFRKHYHEFITMEISFDDFCDKVFSEIDYQQQVSVEPEVKVQIAEMVERHLIAHEQMKEQYLDKNLEMYSKAGAAILALEKLLKDLRKSNLSA